MIFLEEEKHQTSVIIYKFPFPVTKTIKYEKVIKTASNSAAFNSLSGLTKVREEVKTAMSGGSTSSASLSASGAALSYDKLRQSLDKYIPLMFGFTTAFEDNPTVPLSTPISFSWSSPLKNSRSTAEFFNIEFEISMTLFLKGLMHINTAEAYSRSMTEGNFNELAPKAVQILKEAAGIFEFIATSELPRWADAPEKRPPEMFSTVCTGMGVLCLAWAQEFMVLKGMFNGMSTGILAKLMADAHLKYQEAYDTFATKQKESFSNVGSEVLNYTKGMAALSKAQTYKLAALVSKGEKKYGEAVSYAEISIASLREAQMCKAFVSWNSVFSKISQDIVKVQKECDNENQFIAHEKPVDPRMLQIPPNKAIVAPIEFIS